MEQAITTPTPILAEISKAFVGGKQVVQALLVEVIYGLNDYFNITNRMTEGQTIEVINLIMEKYNYFRVADFKLCFNNAKTGIYGKVYNRLDGQVIFEWLNAYNNDRMDVAENLNRIKHQEHKTNGYVIAPEVMKVYKEVLKEIATDQKTDLPKTDKPLKRHQTQADVFAQKWMRHFDNIFEMKRSYRASTKFGSKYIRRYGKAMNMAEFIDYKLEQFARLKPFLEKRK